MNMQEVVEIAQQLITVPVDYEPSFVREVQHDAEPLVWLRFKKKDQQDRLCAEHFSLTFNPDEKKLKGFMHLEDKFETDIIPSEEEAKKIAFDFLKKHAPDLVDTVEVRWIRPLRKEPISPPHDEGFLLSSGKVITGMRVKLFINTNNKYGWVISGKDGHVITFERDITWSTIHKCRTTERWLHDHWLKKQGVNLGLILPS